MKRSLALMAVVLTLVHGTSQANPRHGHHHHHGYPGRVDWVTPIVIGGVLGYALSQANRPVIVQPQPQVIYPNTIPPAPVGYHYEQLLDAYCNCYRWVLVSNY